jgi:hypothetical protein
VDCEDIRERVGLSSSKLYHIQSSRIKKTRSSAKTVLKQRAAEVTKLKSSLPISNIAYTYPLKQFNVKNLYRFLLPTLLMSFVIVFTTNAQLSSYQDVEDKIKKNYLDDSADDLLSPKAYNIFFQKKISTYLSGSSDLSLFQSYATYSSAEDRMNLGFNQPIPRKDPNSRVNWLLNPSIEMSVKDDFATIRDKGSYKSNIRAGLKITKFITHTGIAYFGDKNPDGGPQTLTAKTQKGQMALQRAKIFLNVKRKIDNDSATQILNKRTIDEDFIKDKQTGKFEFANVILDVPSDSIQKKDYNSIFAQYENEFATAEIDYLDKPGSYSFSYASWISVWGFIPLTQKDFYITRSFSEPFQSVKANPWEINSQASTLIEGRFGNLITSVALKVFNNNSASARLLTEVDYETYKQLPGTDTLSLAKIESNKGFVGDYQSFVTTNFNAQIVYTTRFNGLFNFGLSLYYEKNMGLYSANNFKIGIPCVIRGKDKPVNVELVLAMDDLNNYTASENFRQNHRIGLNLGLPITALYK